MSDSFNFSQNEFAEAQSIIYDAISPTLQHNWPLLSKVLGMEVWVKHENHTPLGAFKVRGGLLHMARRVMNGQTNGVITASTGNHGQSIPYAARRHGVSAIVVVPENNSAEKNAAIRALGAELIETGHDFNAAKSAMEDIAASRQHDVIASFHRDLVLGVSTYAEELFQAAGELDAVYVPIGMGSGCSGVISARNRLGLKTEVIGVVAKNANAYALSFQAQKAVASNSALTFAEGMAVRVPHEDAVAIINQGCARVIEVDEDELANSVRLLFQATHNVAEGAGAGALAGAIKEQAKMAGKKIGVILSGGNIDADRFAAILSGTTP